MISAIQTIFWMDFIVVLANNIFPKIEPIIAAKIPTINKVNGISDSEKSTL